MMGPDQRVELKTDRLLLRPFKLEDVDDVYAYAKDPEWDRYLGLPLPQPYARRDAEEYVAGRVLADWSTEPTFAIVLDSTVIGGIGLRIIETHQRAELGYALARVHWGKGLMPEAVQAVIDWAFREYGSAKIYATADLRNGRSTRVMEKLGMTREGVLRSHGKARGERVDEVYYGIIREEWLGDDNPMPPAPQVAPAKPPEGTAQAAEPVELNTKRLLLRPFSLEDVDDVFRYRSDTKWARYLPHVPQPYTRKAAEEAVARNVLESWETDPTWAVVLDQRLIGGVWLMDIQNEIGELGYELSREHWGHGLMPEAALGAITWGFESRGLAKIHASTDSRNTRSERVMQKLGMSREGLLRSHFKAREGRSDSLHYGILREEWEERRGS